MSPFWIKAAQLLLSLSILIILHEGGHFAAAKIFHTKVEKFFLFFDVKFALFKKKIGETVYGIGWLPLGGYVKIAGMIDESMDTEQMEKEPQPWEFRSKPAWQRLIIMVAGVFVNLILGFLIFMMILFVWGRNITTEESLPQGLMVSQTLQDLGFQNGDWVTEVNGKPLENMREASNYLLSRHAKEMTVKHHDGSIQTLKIPENIGKTLFAAGELRPFSPMHSKIIDTVLPNSPAEKSGLEKGDELMAINGKLLKNYAEVNAYKNKHPGESLELEIKREGRAKRIKVTPDQDNLIGFSVKPNVSTVHQTLSLTQSIKEGFGFGYWTLHDYVASFKYVFTKKGASQLGGFGTIGSLFQPSWDWAAFWGTTALISIILAFMNILPIPALDGGHVMFLLYEIISGRKPNEKFLEYAQMIGILLLLALVIYANGNDIYRYFFK